jgi:peptidoglycan/xylan/chitin deacetylase (PgdA/CDA1 family)
MAFRLDRVVTLGLHRTLRWSWGCLPILMYHSISDDAEQGVHPYYRVATHPRRFAQQMEWLAELGCVGLSLERALRLPAGTQANGRRPVAITFDDGFRDFHTAAWPVLRRHGFTATMYLPTGFIGGRRQSLRGKECLTWNEVRELQAQGVRFGSHTATHPKLYELRWNLIERELVVSKERLEQELGVAAESFAYPYAFPQEDPDYTRTLAELLRKQGYRTCVTTIIGRAQPGDERLRLKRLPVNSDDDRALLSAKLDGAYDWLGAAQLFSRQLKRMIRRRPRSVAGVEVKTQLCEP